MNFIIDLILLLIIGFSVFSGIKKGFIKIAISAIGIILSFVLAFSLSAVAATWTYETFVGEKLTATIEKNIDKQRDQSVDEKVDELFASNKMVERMANMCGVTADEVKDTLSDGSTGTIAEQIEDKIIAPAMTFLIRIVYLLILLVILLILTKFLAGLLSKALTISLIGTVNTALGSVAGLILTIAVWPIL